MKKAFSVFAIAILVTTIFVSDGLSQTRIRFARGRTSASAAGYLAGNEIRKFVLGASNGQNLSANVSSGNGCVKFVGEGTTESFITTRGNNELRIINDCGRRTNFTLTVTIN
jgi:hypothetical protein